MPDNDGFMTHELVSGVASSDSRRELLNKGGLSNFTISPSETGISSDESGVGVSDIDMETVDLSPKMKPDGTLVVSNIKFVHPISHRRRNFRYYKKLIQDAFSSRKRLSKEYEHLSILYGEINMESGRQFEPSSLPSSPILSVHETCESEWELL